MIQLPAGFDYSALVNDFISCVVPFVPVFLTFAAYRLIRRIGQSI